MKVLVTGGSGLIGQYCLTQLTQKGYEVHAISTQESINSATTQWHRVNLLDQEQTALVIQAVQPSHLLHLAWCTEHGIYWNSPENLAWLQASMSLIEKFTACGGRRFVGAGTCAEYDWHQAQGECSKESAQLVPASLYGKCKNSLQHKLAAWSHQTKLSSAWGRIFSLYGPHEDPRRLISSTITTLLHQNKAACGYPKLNRDYLHAADVASAFIALLESEIQGPVNIGAGETYTLGEIVQTIATKLNAPNLVELGTRALAEYQEPIFLAPDIARLRLTDWVPQYTLSTGLDDTISWWSQHLNSAQTSLKKF
jgi:nucleoside-diphosphate-sugar epimerase